MAKAFPDSEDFDVMIEPPKRKSLFGMIAENPAPVIGMTATAAALTYGMTSMFSGSGMQSQKAMRMRLIAQFGTIVLGGLTYAYSTKFGSSSSDDK